MRYPEDDAAYEHPDGITCAPGGGTPRRVNIWLAEDHAERRVRNGDGPMVVYTKLRGNTVWVRGINRKAPDGSRIHRTFHPEED